MAESRGPYWQLLGHRRFSAFQCASVPSQPLGPDATAGRVRAAIEGAAAGIGPGGANRYSQASANLTAMKATEELGCCGRGPRELQQAPADQRCQQRLDRTAVPPGWPLSPARTDRCALWERKRVSGRL